MFRKSAGFRLFGVNFSALVIVALVGCAVVFSAVESAKTVVGAKAWAVYQPDFDWVKDNTPKDALVAYRGQCLSYNVNRPSDFSLDKADYAWVNQDFRLEPISILEPDILQQIRQNFTQVYNNSRTGTVVYEKKK